MNYPWRSVIVVPENSVEVARGLAHVITGGDPVEEAKSYSAALSVSGEAPPTYYACCTAVNPEMLAQMTGVLSQGLLIGVVFFRWKQDTLELVSTNVASNHLGESWSWMKCLEVLGLVRIEPTEGA